MWKFFFAAAAYAAYDLWSEGSLITAGVAAFCAVMVFWSAGVVDNYARASNNYTSTNSTAETITVAVNFVFSVLSVGLLIYSFF